MPTHVHDLKNAFLAGESVAQGAHTSTVTGSAVDLGEAMEQTFAIVQAGAITDGTHNLAIQESKNDNTADPEAADAYAAVAPAVSQAIVASAVNIYGFWRSKRWARAVVTVAGATTGGVYAVLLGGMKQRF